MRTAHMCAAGSRSAALRTAATGHVWARTAILASAFSEEGCIKDLGKDELKMIEGETKEPSAHPVSSSPLPSSSRSRSPLCAALGLMDDYERRKR